MNSTMRAHRRELWRGAGDAWTLVTYLVTATGVWAAVGYGLDRLFGTWPILFAIGTVVGHAAGVYVVYMRTMHVAGDARRDRGYEGGG